MTVKEPLTQKSRKRREKSVDEYLGMLTRMMRAAVPRVAEADEVELAQLVKLRDTLDEVIAEAVHGQRSCGRSWAYIGDALGISRQAAYDRWGKR